MGDAAFPGNHGLILLTSSFANEGGRAVVAPGKIPATPAAASSGVNPLLQPGDFGLKPGDFEQFQAVPAPAWTNPPVPVLNFGAKTGAVTPKHATASSESGADAGSLAG